jgi:hypothetical protein
LMHALTNGHRRCCIVNIAMVGHRDAHVNNDLYSCARSSGSVGESHAIGVQSSEVGDIGPEVTAAQSAGTSASAFLRLIGFT